MPKKTAAGRAQKPEPLRASKASVWFVYMLRCSNGALYTGIATDVRKRLKAHNAGKGSAYVRSHRPAKLVAFAASENRSAASALEYRVKALARAQKLALAREWKVGMLARIPVRKGEGQKSRPSKPQPGSG